MFGLNIGHLIIILIIALVIFGPRKLPEIGEALGKGIREFKKSTSEIEDSVKKEFSGTTDTPKDSTASESPKPEK